MKSKGVQIYRRLLGYVRPYRGRIAVSMVASLGVAGSDVTYAKLIQPFVDKVLKPGGQEYIHLIPVFVIGLAAIKGVSRYVQEYFIRTAGQLVVQDVRNDLYSHTVNLSLGYFSRTTAGNLLSRILNDVGQMQRAGASVLVDGLREGTTLIGLVALAFYNDWKLAGVAFLVLPLSLWPASTIGRKIKGYSKRGQAAMGILTAALEQALSGIKVIKAFGTEKQERKKFARENSQYYRFLRKLIKYNAISSPIMELLASFGAAGVLWYGMERVISGAMTQGELFSTMAAILMMYTPVKRLTKVNNTIQRAMGAAERVFETLDEEIDLKDNPGAEVLDRVRGEVEFDNVGFAYDNQAVLEGFNLRAEAGQVVALVGPSGAGKSTVAALLNRFYDPQKGSVRIDGRAIDRVTIESLKQNISFVDQDTFLFNDSIANNIRYGCQTATDEEVRQAARLAYADEFIEQLPSGYETVIGDRGFRLSGGQRQRICIARAFLRNSPILVLDEATSALDTESEAMVQKALANLMRNRTTLVIAHRLSTVMHADKIVVMEDGRICQAGTHQELVQTDGLYRKLYEIQFQDQE